MSLYELISTSAALIRLEDKAEVVREVTDDEWQDASAILANLARFDPTLNLG